MLMIKIEIKIKNSGRHLLSYDLTSTYKVKWRN